MGRARMKLVGRGRMKLVGAAVPAMGVVALLLALFVAGAAGGSGNALMRWDIVQLSRVASGPDAGKILISPGGTSSASAVDGSTITLTGSGTFRSNPGNAQAGTGGGTWSTSGGSIGSDSGTYTVTGFVSFTLAPGTVPAGFVDGVTGVKANARGGLAVFKIAYSDGSDGVLVVSCHLPAGAPDSVFEGITASKGYTDFYNAPAPSGSPDTANSGRTQFHVLH